MRLTTRAASPLLAAAVATLTSRAALAQPPAAQPAEPPPASTTEPAQPTPPPAATTSPAIGAGAPAAGGSTAAGASAAAAASTAAQPEPANGGSGKPAPPSSVPEAPPAPTSKLLVPRYAEDFYPAQPKEDGLLSGIPIEEKTGLRFAMHGYFRAPMRLTSAPRAAGSTNAREGSNNVRTPYLVDDDYFRSGFAYTPVNESDWAEIYLSVGTKNLTATLQLQGTLFSDAARPIIDRQPGVSQGWLTYRTPLDFVPFFNARLRIKGGAFWERFGHLPKYDTYIFGRVHQMGENVRLELEKDDLTLWLQHGIGTHLEDIAANQGLTLLHYASVGASYARTVEVGGYVFDSTSKDKRPLKEITDSSVTVAGVDVRADTHYAGRVYAATSIITADHATYQSPALEVMHSWGGRGLTENYLGTQASENGTGKLWNVGFQYDLSLADLYKTWTGAASSPLPWNGDVFASVFGLYSFIQSKQASPDPILNRDDRKSFKWGADAGYRITEWMAASVRYDRVVLDVDDSANSFRIVSPRLAFFTSFITREMLYFQYSRYMYNERIRLRQGQVQLETMPDDHAFKIQAQITW